MIRKSKVLTVAVSAALAMVLVVAPSAAAEGFFFGSEADVTTLTGTQEGEDVLTTTVGAVKCKSITYSGTASESRVVNVELEPSYSSCTSGAATVAVDVNGCKYRLNAKTESGPPYEGTMDIVCPAGKEITGTVSLFGTTKCTIHIPAQTGLGSVTYANSGSGSTQEITASLNLTGMKYSHTAGLGLGACTSGSASNGTYAGAALVKGESGVSQVGVGINLAAGPTHMKIDPNPKMIFGAADTKKVFTVENKHAVSWNVERVDIVNFKDEKEETQFTIIRNNCPGVILSLGECEIEVEKKAKGQFRWLYFKYGGDWWWSPEHVMKRDIES